MSVAPMGRTLLSVEVRWNDDVLVARTLRRGVAAVGEGRDSLAAVPLGSLGLARLELAEIAGDRVTFTVPDGAVGDVLAGDGSRRLVAGPARGPLACGECVTLLVGEFTLVASAGEAIEVPVAPPPIALGAAPYVLLAAAAHAVVLGSARNAAAADAETREVDAIVTMQELIASADRHELESERAVTDLEGEGTGRAIDDRRGNGRSEGGRRAAAVEGRMGSTTSRASRARAAIARADASPALGRQRELDAARSVATLGALSEGTSAPSASFGDVAAGRDPLDARGSMWAAAIGEATGSAGLGLSGVGLGGGGTGEGVGLGAIGTIGHGAGVPGPGTGGVGTAPLRTWGASWYDGVYQPRRLRVRMQRPYVCGDGVSVTGRLPAETVQRIVRQGMGRFRACYMMGLARVPTLEGTVSTRFVIGADGAVRSSQLQSSTLPDAEVSACIARSFGALTFPPMDDGQMISVVYPLRLTPD